MSHDPLERVIWLRVGGMMAVTLVYLSLRGHLAGLDSIYRVIIVAGAAVLCTLLLVVWPADRSKGKRIGPLLVVGLIFGAYLFSVLYLWGTRWGVAPHAVFVLTLLLGPLLILRRGRPLP